MGSKKTRPTTPTGSQQPIPVPVEQNQQAAGGISIPTMMMGIASSLVAIFGMQFLGLHSGNFFGVSGHGDVPLQAQRIYQASFAVIDLIEPPSISNITTVSRMRAQTRGIMLTTRSNS